MPLDGKIICALVIGSVVGIQISLSKGSSFGDFLKIIFLGQAGCLWIFALYRILILPIVDYIFRRPHLKDLNDMFSIVVEFLPFETYEKFKVEEHGKTIVDMYNHYFAILIWIWVDHLKRTNQNYSLFIDVAKQHYYPAASLYESLDADMESDFTLVSFKEILTLDCPGEREDYIRRLSYATHWAARHMIGDDEKENELSNVFGNLLADFINANKL